jgi:3-deoxy-D-manno-octulosonate 8-phosphate phosphatase, yrbI family
MSKINYDLSKIRGIAFDVDGVLSPSTIPLGEDGVPRRMVNIKDGYALQLAARKGLKLAIISGAKSEAVEARFRALGITYIYMKAADKLPCLNDWLDKNRLSPDEVAFAGDDIPDICVMRHVGLSVAPRDADEFVKSIARYVTVADGGYGVAREILEEVMRAQGLWMSHADAFGW